MEKNLTTKNSSLPEKFDPGAWGEPTMSARDMVIPKILPLNYMSEKVKLKQGEYGEMRDTLSNTKFGDLKSPFQFIPVLLQKKWIEYDMIPSKSGPPKREFKQTVVIQDNPTKAGYNDDFELRSKDGSVERDRIMDFFVLIPSEVEAGQSFPYVLSFRRTSLKGGQKLATQMYVRNANAGKVPAATVCELSAVSRENDKGEFVILDVNPKREATAAEIQAAFTWMKRIRNEPVKVDESDLKPEADTQTSFDLEKETKF